VLEQEEKRFRQTLVTGLKLLDEATAELPEGGTLEGETAFKLYDTYGFPYDLTEDALRTRGLKVDRDGFDEAMERQKSAARAAWKGSGEKASDEMWFDLAEEFGSTEFIGYSGDEGEGVVLAIVKDGKRVQSAKAGETVQVLLNQTPFYGESGGQIGDSGKLTTIKGFQGDVEDTSKPLVSSTCSSRRFRRVNYRLERRFTRRSIPSARPDPRQPQRDPSASCRASQAARHPRHPEGQPGRSRPFPLRLLHPKAMSREEIEAVEAEVNALIRSNEPVTTRLMTPDEAIAAGAMALFGEKYGDEVRVLSMGRMDEADYSVELCGGTHVRSLGDIQLLKIVGESAVSSGVRRIEALTGEAARRWLTAREGKLRDAAAVLKSSPDEVPSRVAALIDERKRWSANLPRRRRRWRWAAAPPRHPSRSPNRSTAALSSARWSKDSIPRICAAPSMK
jgi:alanyl-tRNA synthetase